MPLSHESKKWMHRLSAHVPLPHLHHHQAQSSISLPISTDADNQWDLSVPQDLVQGTTLTKVSQKQQKQLTVSIDPNEGRILYKSRVSGIIPIESIKELRTGHEGAYYRDHFSLPASYDERWITIVHIRNCEYKTTHFVAPTLDVFNLWDQTLRRLHAVRQGLMQGLGNLEVREKLWEKIYWKDADSSGDKRLDSAEMRNLCCRLGILLSEPEFQSLFKQADTRNKGYLEYADFQQFAKIVKRRPEMETIYNKLCESTNGTLNLTVFQRFMREYQKSKLSDEELKAIFERHTAASASSSVQHTPDIQVTENTSPRKLDMRMDQFRTFLLSEDNSPFSEQNKGVWQDMTRPISEYYISSSHNTYLVGHQLVGVSTIEGYIRALLHSCRTVEMDIYDGTAGEPVVYHGNTLTFKVTVRDICQAISKYAFVTSPYPVMISAEIHCNVKQQDKMVEIMREIFDSALISTPDDGTKPKIDQLPSPDDLKGKILLKAKNPLVNKKLADLQAQRLAEVIAPEKAVNANESDYTSEGTSECTSEGTSDEGVIKSIFRRVRRRHRPPRHTPTPPQPTPEVGSLLPLNASGGSATATEIPEKSQKLLTTHKPKLSDALASLLVYTVGVTCLGLGAGIAHVSYAPEHIFSLSENKANRVMKSQTLDSSLGLPSAPGGEDEGSGDVVVANGSVRTGMWDLIKHNQGHLTRIYPKGTRVNSSNYEPHRYWAAGAQVAAINWQTFDLGYVINQSMFQRNGKSGYVLKPTPLRRIDNDELLSKRTDHFLEMTIISAQQLPRPLRHKNGQVVDKSVLDPYVEVSLHIPDWTQSPFIPPTTSGPEYSPPTERATAAQASSARTVSVRTRAIKNNGFNPVWNEDLCIPYDCVGGGEMQELIFVNVKVRQEGKDTSEDPIALHWLHCVPLGCLEQGFRHLPLYDSQLSQHLFATLFVQIRVRDA
ncbi:hypothetical protein M378DRAFT_160517 [Amanita muscaria Koide BX008]|uniref:Phosphoinositide phospholipase C n=1 Tax=Amanita muscaria (strain Koide BX008) TaxID=946122 RepID=A0A0C2XB45_AMAMK|nr:hypothetical protein M378DRAFT_160517 [Amanita muscaria Koide BX008]